MLPILFPLVLLAATCAQAATIAQIRTSIAVTPARAVYNGKATLLAKLTANEPLSSKVISFSVRGQRVGVAVTDSLGIAKLEYVEVTALEAGKYSDVVRASFEGDDRFERSDAASDLEIVPATPIITWSQPSAIVYGTALSTLQLNAKASVPGVLTYEPPSPTVLAGGEHELHVKFTPTDIRNYTSATAHVSIRVTVAKEPADWELVRLAQPAIAKNILAGTSIVDRHTGKELLVLANNNEGSGMELIFVDVGAGIGNVYRAPAGAGAEGLTEVPGDRLLLGTFYDGDILVFDLNRMDFIKTLKFPNEQYIWGFVIGNDGRAYAGTFPGGKLGAIDVDTYALEDLGAAAKPNTYLRTVSPAPDGRVLCSYLAADPVLLVFDPRTKKFTRAPDQLQGIRQAAVWNGYLVARNQAFEGHDFKIVDPLPFPAPPEEGGEWQVDTVLTTPTVLYIRQGQTYWRYQKGARRLQLLASVSLRGGRLFAVTKRHYLVGYRGQDYFVVKPGATNIEVHPIPGPSSPRALQFLRVDPSGRIWGGPPYGQTLFSFEPATGALVNTPTISDVSGEVYDVAFFDGCVYAVSYSGGEVIRYDPRMPWGQLEKTNPVVIAKFSDKGYIRPIGGVIVGPGQKLYSGWQVGLGAEGGALAITDPRSGQTRLVENPLGVQGITGIATDGKLLYVGTGFGSSGLPSEPGRTANLGIIDPESGTVIWQAAVPAAWRVRPLGFDEKSGVVPLAVNNDILLFDTKTRTLRDPKVPPIGSYGVAITGGKLYYGAERQVIVLDLLSQDFDTFLAAPSAINNVVRGPDGAMYVGVWTDLYAVRPAASSK